MAQQQRAESRPYTAGLSQGPGGRDFGRGPGFPGRGYGANAGQLGPKVPPSTLSHTAFGSAGLIAWLVGLLQQIPGVLHRLRGRSHLGCHRSPPLADRCLLAAPALGGCTSEPCARAKARQSSVSEEGKWGLAQVLPGCPGIRPFCCCTAGCTRSKCLVGQAS